MTIIVFFVSISSNKKGGSMDKKGKILNFTIKNDRKKKHIFDDKGEIIDIKSKEKDELTNELLDAILYLTWLLEEIYKDIYDVKDIDFIMASREINKSISELEEFYEKVKNIDNPDINELIFKLKIMVNQSCYFVDIFDELDGEKIDLFELKYYVSLAELYIKSMDDIICNNSYDYNDFNAAMDSESKDLAKTIIEIEEKNKKEAYTSILSSKTKEILGRVDRESQVSILSDLITDTVNSFLDFDVDIMLNYYNTILNKYISSGILENPPLEVMDLRKMKLELDKGMEKKYYYVSKIIGDFIVFALKFASYNDSIKLSNEFDKLYSLIDKMHNNDEMSNIVKIMAMDNIEKVMKLINDKIISMVNAKDLEKVIEKLENIFSDEVILNSIYTIKDQLLDGKINGIDEDSFSRLWIHSRKVNIDKYLTNIIRKEMFLDKDRDFYSNSKYRDLVELEINLISKNAYYAGLDVGVDYIKDDFSRLLEMLKLSFNLEKSASLYGFDNILEDISRLNYLDYTNTIRYLDMLKHVFGGMDKIYLKGFLDNASYLPMSVKYENRDYISLYKNKVNSLIMDNGGYYLLVSNEDISEMKPIVLDMVFSDKDNTYNRVINSFLSNYDRTKRGLELKRERYLKLQRKKKRNDNK